MFPVDPQEPNKPHSSRPQPVIQNPSIPWNCLERRWRCNVEVLQKPFEEGSWFRGGSPIIDDSRLPDSNKKY